MQAWEVVSKALALPLPKEAHFDDAERAQCVESSSGILRDEYDKRVISSRGRYGRMDFSLDCEMQRC